MAARTQRTLLEKKNILKAYENLSTDLTKSEKAKKLKIPLSTLHGILKDKDILQDKNKSKELENESVGTEMAFTTQSILLFVNGSKKQEEKVMQSMQISFF